MPFNGSGVFVRGFSWVNDATNSIPITATRMDSDTNDIVTNGLGLCLTRDGQGAAIANLPMNGFRHTGASNGVASSDYATMGQIAGFAPLASPAFTGTPTAPTAASGTNTTQIATTQFVASNFLQLTGGTIAGSLVVSTNIAAGNTISAAFITSSQNLTTNNGFFTSGTSNAVLSGSGGAVIIRPTGAASSFSQTVFDSATGNVTFPNNLNVAGVVVLGGTNQPTIFVQAGTPTARAVGDLWFF